MVAGGSAWHVALRRAAHQLYDTPRLFDDPFAVPLLGREGAAQLARTPQGARRTWSRSLRAFTVARSWMAEQALAHAVAGGVRQYCVFGAGLDTFALRNPWPHLCVIEADRPNSLAWKRQLLDAAGLKLPFAAVQTPCDLAALPPCIGGMHPAQPAFFSLLGVAPYLPAAALAAVLARVQACGAGSGIVFDYRLPRHLLTAEEQRQHDSLLQRVSQSGEPFSAQWEPEAMGALLAGFSNMQQLDAAALNARCFDGRADGLCVLGDAVRLVQAWV